MRERAARVLVDRQGATPRADGAYSLPGGNCIATITDRVSAVPGLPPALIISYRFIGVPDA